MWKTVLILWLCLLPGALSAQASHSAAYAAADSIAGLFSGHSLDHPALLAQKLTQDLPTDRQKFRALYTWICTNITNDYRLYEQTRRRMVKYKDQPEALAAWQRAFAPLLFRKLREKRTTLCTGYAYLLRELARHAGLEAEIINGYSRTAGKIPLHKAYINHAWNAVRLDGKWYLCDPTWSSGYIKDRKFIPRYDDAYFLADPHLFILNHYPADTAWALLDEVPSLDAFLSGPYSYMGAYAYHFTPATISQEQLTAAKQEPFTISFRATPGLEKAIGLVVHKGAASRSVTPEVVCEDGLYTLTHSFRTAGRYDVHIKLEDTLVATFPVRVQ